MKQDDDKRVYLQLIQEPICRMSTISSVLKGFCATVVIGIPLINYCRINIIVLILSFLPVISFAALDIFYLMLEKKYRYLYDQVRVENHEIDFSMTIKNISRDEANARIRDCIKSPSILLFYPLMIVICIVVVCLKIIGGI